MATCESDDVVICRCEEVLRSEVVQAIGDGCQSVIWVKRLTRAGMGLCQGRTCGHLVAQLIAQETDRAPADIAPDTRRPPLRPIGLDILDESEG